MIRFDEMFDRAVGNEGGYVNDPADPGGETNWGISRRSYPALNIKNLSREAAKGIYRRDFWERAHMDEYHPAIAFQVFDFAVNSGIDTAVRKLQAAAGVADDGHVGERTIAAIKAMSVTDLIMRFVAQRLRYWTKLKNWPHDGAGWANRAAKDLEYAAEDA